MNKMSTKLEDCAWREIFQKGRWILLRVGESHGSKCATISERNSLWRNLPGIKSDRNEHGSKTSKQSPKNDVTQTSKIMKRDKQSRTCPWISTTQKDFYGQRHPKVTGWKMDSTSVREESKLENMERLICSVSHVPAIRMNCYGDGHFHTTYNRSYVDHVSRVEPPEAEADYDTSRLEEKPAVPFSSKSWNTTYRFDYGLQPEDKPSMGHALKLGEPLISREPDYQAEWSTTYQDYGSISKRNRIEMTPCRERYKLDNPMEVKLEPTSEVGRLLKY